MNRRFALAGLGASGLWLLGRRPAAGQDEERADGFRDLTGFVLSGPIVDIGGPYPTLLRVARVGDLIQVQIRYPTSPPLPKAAKIVPASRIFRVVGGHESEGQVAILKPDEPQQGVIGVGFLVAFVRAMSEGQGAFTVHIERGDDSVVEVPFHFKVEAAE